MPSILDEIVAHKLMEVSQRKQAKPLGQLAESAIPNTERDFLQAIQPQQGENGFVRPKLILEVKPASPSAGILAEAFDPSALLMHYNAHASAISVLTDSRYFKGSHQLLTQVARHSPHPVLCKDFILDPYQVLEARHAEAHAVLLIVKILTDEQFAILHDAILSLGMTPVVEIQNESELARALAVQPQVLLINNRDLGTFTIDLETTLRLVPQIPADITCISASGIETRSDIDKLLVACGTFLVGSALMRLPLEALPLKLKELAGQ